MRKVIPIPIFNLTSITPRTVQSHLYDHGYTTLISDLELYHGSNHVAFHYLSREIWYSICCCAKKMTIYSKFYRRYFFACVTKNQNPSSTCTSLICVQLICKTSYLEICRRSYLYNKDTLMATPTHSAHLLAHRFYHFNHRVFPLENPI